MCLGDPFSFWQVTLVPPVTVQVSRQKMFQLWKLVLLCGLLAGASASLLGDIGGTNEGESVGDLQ